MTASGCRDRGRRCASLWLLLWLSLAAAVPAGAEDAAALEECRGRNDAAERLRCYDALGTEPLPAGGEAPAAAPVLAARLEKERDLARRAFAIVPHRPNYLLYSYNADPNEAPFQALDPGFDLQEQELKFQISLRVPLWNRVADAPVDLWFAYTQLSFWQAFNSAESAPFRETNYEPELAVSIRTDFALLGLEHRLLSVGVAHQSNGRSDPLSRSWNRLWVSFEMGRDNLVLVLKPWYRLPEDPASDDNPDLEEYAGRMELRAAYKFGDQVFSALLRNNLRMHDNRSGYELDWSFPYSKRIKGLLQYWNGYGESLIDYNVRTQRIGFGVLVEDWL